MSGIGNYTFRVSPESIQSEAEKLYSQISKLSKIFSQISEKIESSKNYWQGEAADTYRNDYKSDDEDIIEMLKRVKEHVIDLNAIASIYTNVENNLKEEIMAALDDDVIF